MEKKPNFFVISGPSGSGKTSLCRKIANDNGFYYSISHTTRPQRENEVDGQDYFFVDEPKFMSMVDSGDMLEWARVYDNLYGTSKSNIEKMLAKGRSVIVDVDSQGASQIKKLMPFAVLIFIRTPSLDDLQQRLSKRGRDSTDEIKKRMSNAESELTHMKEYDHIIVNDDFEDSAVEIQKIVDTAGI